MKLFPQDIKSMLLNLSELYFLEVALHFRFMSVRWDDNSDARYLSFLRTWNIVYPESRSLELLRQVILAVVTGQDLPQTPDPQALVKESATARSTPIPAQPIPAPPSIKQPPAPPLFPQPSVSSRLTMLHLTDLHFGRKNRFQNENLYSLGRSFAEQMLTAKNAAQMGQDPIDCILVTGDIAETGDAREFEDGGTFLLAVAEFLNVRRSRVFFVPGNHDISWALCKQVTDTQQKEHFDDAELARRLSVVKLQYYEEFRRRFYGTELEEMHGYQGLACGAEIWDIPELEISIAAVNTCERESHLEADQLGTVGHQQAKEIMKAWEASHYSHWKKIMLVHHNPAETVESNRDSWRKWINKEGMLPADKVERFMADITGFPGKDYLTRIVSDRRVQLILHGHHHAHPPSPIAWQHFGMPDACYVLSTGSWGLQDADRPAREANTCQIIQIRPDEPGVNLHVQGLVYDPQHPVHGQVHNGGWCLMNGPGAKHSLKIAL